MFAAYHKLLQTHPLPTRMITSGLICSFTDFINQKFIQKHQDFNFRRNINLFLVGAFYSAPVLHFWYSKIVPIIQTRVFNPQTPKIKRVLTMVAIDQSTIAPVMFTGFFLVNGFLNLPSIDGIKKGIQDWQNKFGQTIRMNWKIWPLAIGINFWFVPAAYRVLFSNAVSFFWNIILSSLAYDKKNCQNSAK